MTSTSAWECADTRQALGVYVLGAIDPAERALVDAHVAGCPDCRDELAGLAGLPALLSRVGADEIGRIDLEDLDQEDLDLEDLDLQDIELPPAADEPREDFADSLVSLTAARRRRHRRWQVAAAAAAVVIAAGGAAASYQLVNGPAAGASAEPAPPASWQTARTTSTMNGINATIRYSKLSWGVAYDVQITGIPSGTTCQLWVTDAQGVHLLAAGWTVSSRDPDPWYPGSSWVPAGQVKGMDVTAGNEQLATFTTG
ncbi:MAG TPA: zf-HC2 domain-containing protein [Streptosporangiaceae bacterium]|nr:zf-HC2 domain-containing protein [Streptosporangiaceae bacterium]